MEPKGDSSGLFFGYAASLGRQEHAPERLSRSTFQFGVGKSLEVVSEIPEEVFHFVQIPTTLSSSPLAKHDLTCKGLRPKPAKPALSSVGCHDVP